MLPTYQPGAVLFGWRRRKLKVGDIVIAKHKEIEIVKRITHIESAGYFLKGDNPQQSSDSRTYGIFSRQAIKGVVIGSIAG
jgi:phage repressor protein C with HTH and peptisase S24 domain